MATLSIDARLCYRFRWLGGVIWEISVQMDVGLILLCSTLFFLEEGDDAQAREYARLKGEREAIEKASIQKGCGIEFRPIVPPKPLDSSDNKQT